MKLSCTIFFLVVAANSAFASPCRTACRAEYRDCRSDARNEAQDNFIIAGLFGVGGIDHALKREAITQCKNNRTQCFAECDKNDNH